MRNPDNSLLIQADLETFREYDGEYANGLMREIFIPCPYVTMLYLTTTAMDPNGWYNDSRQIIELDPILGIHGEYHKRTHVPELKERSTDNNSGFTIFDVTDPQHPRYCMVLSAFEDRVYHSINAKDYVIMEENLTEEPMESIRPSYEGFYGVPLIDKDTLAEVFPREFDGWMIKWKREQEKVNQTRLDEQESMGTPPDVTPQFPSLLSITAKSILRALIADPGNSAENIRCFLRVPLDGSTVEMLHSELTKHSELLNSILPLVAWLLNKKPGVLRFVDMTLFALSATQLESIVRMIFPCEILKLGGRNEVCVDSVKNMVDDYSL